MKATIQSTARANSGTESPSDATPRAPQLMKAVAHDRYGSFDLLGVRDTVKPLAKDDEVLVRVVAAGLHVGDCFGVQGTPFFMRMITGFLKPKVGIPGFDLAGHVEAVGKNVTRFQPGDEVFGTSTATCADYVCAKEEHLAHKPAGLRFEEAAAIPTSALAALHALRDVARVRPGHKVLINGASGGVGTFAVQIAKWLGAEVTGVCSTKNVAMVRSLGADRVIDYTKEDFTKAGPCFDLVFDNVENRSLAECRRALTPDGILILNSGTGASGLRMMIRLFKPLVVSPFVRHDLRRYLSVSNHLDLVVLKDLVDTGTLTPVVEQTYPLAETEAALTHIDRGHTQGKVVVTLQSV